MSFDFRTRLSWIAVVLSLSALAAHCAAAGESGSPGVQPTSDASTDEVEPDGGFSLDAVPEGSVGPSKKGCSADLHRVIDDLGGTIETCAPEQGCAKGACVAACEAAAESHGNIGCDFIVPTPVFRTYAPPCFTVFVTNNWGKAIRVSVSRGTTSFDSTKFVRIPTGGSDPTKWSTVDAAGIPVDQVGVLFLSSDPDSGKAFGLKLGCPVPQATPSGTEVLDSGRGEAFHIKTDFPVSAYDILPYGGAPSFLPGSTLLLPTTAWGKNYVAVATPRFSGNHKSDPGSESEQFAQIVASADDTTVSLLPTVDFPGGTGLASATKGSVATYKLDAGEYLQWFGKGLAFSGSVISSDKPVALETGGGLCLGSATSAGGGCDIDHDQLPPVSALGSEYVAAPWETRARDLSAESIVYRVVGTVDGTKLEYDPAIAGAPTTLKAGELVEIEAAFAFRIASQDKDHPFYIAQLMSGCQTIAGSRPGCTSPADAVPVTHPFYYGCLGDEDHVGIIPAAQFLSRYVFFTDPSYGTTTLALTRVKSGGGFKDVTIDCIGKVTGWKPVGTSGRYEVTTVDLSRTDGRDPSKSYTKCVNGRHVAESDGSFGVVVWGLDQAASYGYPAGGSVAAINTVIVPTVPK